MAIRYWNIREWHEAQEYRAYIEAEMAKEDAERKARYAAEDAERARTDRRFVTGFLVLLLGSLVFGIVHGLGWIG